MNTGDRVALINDDDTLEPEWHGLVGTIIENDHYVHPTHVKIQPDEDRPDGEGTEWFYWPEHLMTKVD